MRVAFSRAPVTLLLLAAIAGVFVLEVIQGGSTDQRVLLELGANSGPHIARGEVWRLFTAMFLHIGLLHLVVNGWALFQLGALMEIWVGSLGFSLVYLASGLGGSAASFLWTWVLNGQEQISAGASGAIFGVLGALIGFLLRRRDRLTPAARSLLTQLVFWAGLNVFLGFSVPGIDNAGHLGGLAVGLVLGPFLDSREQQSRGQPRNPEPG